MTVAPIESFEEFQTLINSGKPILIDFWAEWCGPCRFISPVLDKLASSYPEVGVYKVDVDAQEKIAQEVGIRAMPTFILFRNGEKVNDLVGAVPNKLTELLNEAKALV
ncbi:hypothetical protein APHAL10511_005078 [Amanita phalloides]|nr:hypothetical protein APHAL10511_005078 [Amanita phalloides]